MAKERSILALVSDAYGGHGGIALYNRDVIEGLCADPATRRIVALPRIQTEPLEDMPDKLVWRDSALGGKLRFLRSLATLLLTDRDFDLVYCAHINLVPLARMAASILGVPWVVCFYGFEAWQPPHSQSVARGIKHADRVFTVSSVTRERFLGWSGYPADRCIVMPNAIDLSRYPQLPKDRALLARHGLDQRKVVMTLGRLDASEQAKGFDRMIEILPRLKAAVPEIAYLIVGKGDDRARLESLALAKGVSDRVVFAGFVSEAEKPAYYAIADAFVMPSKFEGFGYVFLEAMACGVPVVASSIDGGRDAVKDGEIGLMVDPFDPDALVAATLEALTRPRLVPEGLKAFTIDNYRQKQAEALAPLFAKSAT